MQNIPDADNKTAPIPIIPLSPVFGEFSFAEDFFDVVETAVVVPLVLEAVFCDVVSDDVSVVIFSMTVVVVVSVLVDIADIVVVVSSLSGTNSKLFSFAYVSAVLSVYP